MRILVDAMCTDFGGIATYAQCLLAGWPAEDLGDELHVAVPSGSTLDTHLHTRHELGLMRPSAVGRPVAQSTAMLALARRLRVDVVLSTATTTTVRSPGVPLAVVVHDLRHELRPDQFTRARRVLKSASYARSYRLATGFVAISHRTLDDLHRLHPATASKPSAVVHHGADHVADWAQNGDCRRRHALAFAHHTNKRPELVVRGWAAARRRGLDLPPLLVIGAAGQQRERLAQLIASSALDDSVTLADYLPDEEFRRALSTARVVVFPSEFEGFGLPVIESMLLGVPTVIAPEPALLEVSGGHASVMDAWSPDALAVATAAACARTPAELAGARDHAAHFRWESTARETRSFLATLAN